MATAKKNETEIKDTGPLLHAVDVKLEFDEYVYGSLPKDADLLTAWIASKAEKSVQDGGRYGDEDTLPEKLKALGLKTTDAGDLEDDEDDIKLPTNTTPDKDGVEEQEEKVSCCFRSHIIPETGEAAIVMRDFQIKAAIGQAATTMKITTKIRGAKPNLRDGLQIRPQHIPLMRDGMILTEADGQHDFIGHVMTMQGRRSILKRCDYVDKAQLEFTIYWVRDQKLVTPEMMKEILTFAGMFNGLGSQRRFEAGKYKIVGFNVRQADVGDLLNR